MSRCNCFPLFSRRACYTLYNIPQLYLLKITQIPSAPRPSISFFCCATPHKQETNQKLTKNQNETNKPQTFAPFSVSQKPILFKNLRACKASSLETTSTLNQMLYFQGKVRFCCLLGFFCRLGFFLLLGFGLFGFVVFFFFFLSKPSHF